MNCDNEFDEVIFVKKFQKVPKSSSAGTVDKSGKRNEICQRSLAGNVKVNVSVSV